MTHLAKQLRDHEQGRKDASATAGKSAQHTPGPWTLRKMYRERYGLIVAFSVESETRNPIAGITVTDQSQEDIANARLIAAAPELLEACKELSADAGETKEPYNSSIVRRSIVTKIRAAIAKSEGK